MIGSPQIPKENRNEERICASFNLTFGEWAVDAYSLASCSVADSEEPSLNLQVA